MRTIIPQKKVIIKRSNIRACVLNKWNYRFKHYVHQGKYLRAVRPTIYHIGYKLGMLAQTRKPFFFRSKKKKR